MVKDNKDVVGCGAVKDSNSCLVVESARIRDDWSEYYEKLLNAEFHWRRDKLDKVEPVSGPAEEIKSSEVREEIAKSKSDKASGPSGVVSEMLRAAGEPGMQWVTSIFNDVIREGKIPTDWSKSWLVNVYKGKGDALACGSYRGIKLLDQVMKILQRVVEKRIRERVTLDEIQFGCRPGRGTIDAIFIAARHMQEKFLAKKKGVMRWLLWIWREGFAIECPDKFVVGFGGLWGVVGEMCLGQVQTLCRFFETMRGTSLKVKGKFYKACVQSGDDVWCSETWAMKVEYTQKLKSTEASMMRRMCGISLKSICQMRL